MLALEHEQEQEQERARPPWSFPHPPIGTCVFGCASFGRCHCGCGEQPKPARVTDQRQRRVRGFPNTFCQGHHARVFPRRTGSWTTNGVPIEKIRPLLAWLHTRYETWQDVADILGIPVGTLKGYANNRARRHVPPAAAQRIQQAVLAHKLQRSWLHQWEVNPILDHELSPRRRVRRYPAERKHLAVAMVEERSIQLGTHRGAVAQVARELGVGERSLHNWVKQRR